MTKVASKLDLDKNARALKSYDTYREAADIIERAEVACGKRVLYQSATGSTLNCEINLYGICSTTAQEI